MEVSPDLQITFPKCQLSSCESRINENTEKDSEKESVEKLTRKRNFRSRFQSSRNMSKKEKSRSALVALNVAPSDISTKRHYQQTNTTSKIR
jgi:hypothetical protein